MYEIEFFPVGGRGGGVGYCERRKKKKKKNFKLFLLALPKHKRLSIQHNLTLFEPKIYCAGYLMGKKIFDFVLR